MSNGNTTLKMTISELGLFITKAPYYELQKQAGGNTKIKYLGLVQTMTEKGFGGALLTHALEQAWLWKGTCRMGSYLPTRPLPMPYETTKNAACKCITLKQVKSAK